MKNIKEVIKMIIVELVDNDTRERRYSDQKMKLRQIETQVLYDDAVDVIPCKYTYEETDIPIDEEPEPQTNPEKEE
jgi:hypothetical protein